MGMNCGFDRVRLQALVGAGKRVRLHSGILSVDRQVDNCLLIKIGDAIQIEAEEAPAPALAAERLNRVVTA